MSERMFPIQRERGAKPHPTQIPWSLAELAYSVYSARYGTSQSLERLAERHGFGPSEMDDFLPDWRERCDEIRTLRDERDRLREALRIMKEATYQGHSAHWDPTGGSGSGCPACQRASELRDQAQAALTPAGQRLTPNEATE